VREPQARQHAVRALPQVPVAADAVKVPGGCVAGENAFHPGEPLRDPQHPREGLVHAHPEVLREIADRTRAHHGAGGRAQLTRQQAHERALAGAVRPDEPRALAAEAECQIGEEGAAVSQRERQPLRDDANVGRLSRQKHTLRS